MVVLLSVVSLFLLFAWETWESLSPVEVLVNAFVREFVMLSFVGFKLHNEVDKVLWLLELLKVLSVNDISQFIFNLDDQLN